jgi:hypothetical protein
MKQLFAIAMFAPIVLLVGCAELEPARATRPAYYRQAAAPVRVRETAPLRVIDLGRNPSMAEVERVRVYARPQIESGNADYRFQPGQRDRSLPSPNGVRGQGARMYQGYRGNAPEDHQQALDWDRQDQQWSEDERQNRRLVQEERERNVQLEMQQRQQAQYEQQTRFNQEMQQRQQRQYEADAQLRRWEDISRSVQDWRRRY